MYSASLNIKKKNLGAQDDVVIITELDLARTALAAKEYPRAVSLFKAVLPKIRLNGQLRYKLLQQALEGYADALWKNRQQSEADKVFDELRKIQQ